MKVRDIDLGSRGEIKKPIRVNVTNESTEPMEVRMRLSGYGRVQTDPVSDEELARQVLESLQRVEDGQ